MSRRSSAYRWPVLCLAFVLALIAPLALADTPIALFQSFAGNVNFTGTEATWRTSGTNFCSVITKKNQTVSKTLSSIPAGATVLAAHLYWAGSGTAADYSVTMNNGSGTKTITAQRQYTGSYVQGNTTYSYFGGAADVTSLVTGNGTFSFGGLTVDASSTYCTVQGVLGGFALLVVYSDPTQPFRVLNMYEGFQYTHNSSITLNLSNFRMPNPLGSATGRIGHITWEGDQSLNQQGENLSFNGTVMTDALNPSGNQFDSQSNIDGDTASYGIDFDAYTVGDPIIKAGDTSSTTTYASGQDLVWLNVELVAVPNVPTADLQVTMSRSGEPVAGGGVTYTILPCNNGPYDESGPIVVTNTLPPGMSYSSVSGTGWTCSISGQTATCNYSGSAPKNQNLPTITVNATVGTTGQYSTYTDTATISGQMFDNVSGNNTASDTSTDATLTAGNYAFTLGSCATGIAIGGTGSGCTRYVGPYTAGTDQQLYITNLKNGIPTQVKNSDTTVKMQFSLSCINPSKPAGVAANFAGQALQLCYQNGVVPPSANNSDLSTYWSPVVNIYFPGKQASGKLTGTVPVFTYPDVGLVQLNLYDTAGNATASARFVSAPQSLKLGTIQNSDGGLNPAGNSAFAKSGDTFSVGVLGMTAPYGPTQASVAAPNFGNAGTPYGPASVKLTLQDGTPVPVTAGVSGNGVITVNATVDVLGSISLLASGLVGQDGSSGYFGAPVAPSAAVNVGYFYPAYFQTVACGLMTCLAPMACPTGTTANGDDLTVAGAAYSSQPFTVSVKAYTASGTDATTAAASLPPFQIVFDPYTSPGAAGVALVKSTDFLDIVNNSVASNVVGPAGPAATPKISLKTPFVTGTPRAAWQAPLSAYMRASANFVRPAKAADGTQTTKTYTVTSNRGNGPKSVEGGVRIVHGRLQVSSGFGSELLKLPLHVYAQYWTGTSWNNNPNDSDTPITFTNTSGVFTNCAANLKASAGAPFNCKTAPVLSFAFPSGGSPGTVNLDSGQGTLWMLAPGAGNNGKADVAILPSAPWLPSTIGQAVFGVYKSPLIYIREVY